jgi:hypothetical protein
LDALRLDWSVGLEFIIICGEAFTLRFNSCTGGRFHRYTLNNTRCTLSYVCSRIKWCFYSLCSRLCTSYHLTYLNRCTQTYRILGPFLAPHLALLPPKLLLLYIPFWKIYLAISQQSDSVSDSRIFLNWIKTFPPIKIAESYVEMTTSSLAQSLHLIFWLR